MGRNKPIIIKDYCSNQNGASLVFILLVSFILITLATIIVRFSNTDIQSTMKQENQINAYYIAEAGMEDAVNEINKKLAINENPGMSLPTTNFSNGTYDVTIAKKINKYNEEAGYLITSIGLYQGEKQTLTSWVKELTWPGSGEKPDSLKYTVFSNSDLFIQIQSLIALQGIKINGDVHANNLAHINHTGLLAPAPVINGTVTTSPFVPIAKFDFDKARNKAIEEKRYSSSETPISLTSINVSILKNSDSHNYVFIDGDLSIASINVQLLNILQEGLTIICNGSINLTNIGVSLGNSAVPLNLIAKDDITLSGLDTAYKIKGILFSQEGKISSNFPIKVDGYTGGQSINLNGGLVDSLLSAFSFNDDPSVFDVLPSGIGFKQNVVEVIEQKESAVDGEK